MKLVGFTVAYISFSLISAFAQGVTAAKPRITLPTSNETFLQEGDELKIVCEGKGKLNITQQKLIGGNNQSAADTTKTNGKITFTIPRVVVDDAGWYACAEEGVVVENTELIIERPSEDITWIYVWVHSNDPNITFALMHDHDIPELTGMSGDDLLVPCRPTSPFTKVTLLSVLSPLDESLDVRCEPKIGCIIKAVDTGDIEPRSPFICAANWTGGATPVVPEYHITVSARVDITDSTIDLDQIPHVVWGANATLQCNVTISELVKDITWDWYVPEAIPENQRSITSTYKLLTNSNNKCWSTELHIIDVKKNYGGNYKCCVKTGKQNDNICKARDIEIRDPAYYYINITPQANTTTIEVKLYETAQWSFKIDSYPKAKLTWYRNKKRIDVIEVNAAYDDNKHKYLHTSDIYVHLFKLINATMYDSGNYTVNVTTPKNTTEVVLYLTVKVAPVIEKIQSSASYYKKGENALITCQAKGSPVPNATWSFAEWVTETQTCTRECAEAFQTDTKNNDTFLLESKYRLPEINLMGNITCKACNVEGCVEDTVAIFVSDIDDGGFFGINKPASVIEGDNVTITCAASVFNYTENIDWKLKDDKDLKPILSSRITVERTSTSLTKQSVLKIRELAKGDAGNYTCIGESKNGDPESVSYVLKVIDSERANIMDSNMKYISIDPDTYLNQTIDLFCKASGKPAPRIEWFHNDKPIENTSADQFELSQDRSKLIIKTSFVRSNQGGEYKCVARNRVNSVEKRAFVKIRAKADHNPEWIGGVCVLIIVIVVVITYMGIKIHRERMLRIELNKAGLTHFIEGAPECLNSDLTVDEQAELLPYDKKWEFPRDNLKIGKQLGSGAFGVVMRAEARGICAGEEVTTVAVKMVRRTADPSYMKALASELKIMIHLGRHLNVVNLLGACTEFLLTKRELYVIVEYCRYGNVHKYLQLHRETFIDQVDPETQIIDSNIGMERLVRRESTSSQNRVKSPDVQFSRSMSVGSSDSTSGAELFDYRPVSDFDDINMSPDGGVLSNNSVQPGWRSNYRGDYREQNLKPICTQDLLCWAWQVARGMEYLSSRNVLHGDLAARNILLADDNIVKICDFGLAKNMYKDDNYKKKGDGPLPLKWMAVESIRDGTFSTQSDVWSYGIVLWEFFTLARTPYPGMEPEKQYDKLIEGYRMEKPKYATDQIYKFMLHCWKGNPSLRPKFPELAEKIGNLLNDSVRLHISDMNSPYMEMNTAALENGKSDYLTMMLSPDHGNRNSLGKSNNDYINSPVELSSPGGSNSNYIPMTPVKRVPDAGIFSPRAKPDKFHFEFPIPEEIQEAVPCSNDSTGSAAKLGNGNQNGDPIDFQQNKVIFVNEEKNQTSVAIDPAYCNVGVNSEKVREPENGQLRSIDDGGRADGKLSEIQQRDDDKKELSSPVISLQQNNYVNMPKNKINSQTKDNRVNAFNNPNYIGLPVLGEVK